MVGILGNPGAVNGRGIECWSCKGRFFIPINAKDPKYCCYCGSEFKMKKTQMGVLEQVFGRK